MSLPLTRNRFAMAKMLSPVQHVPLASTLPATMRAGQISQPQQATYSKVDLPTPKEHEVLIKVEGCGVCGSNLPIWEGREWFNYPLPPGNPGHEGWGRVAALGAAV